MKRNVKFLCFNSAESFQKTNLACFPELEGLLLNFRGPCRVDLSANPKLLYFKAKGIDCYSLNFAKNQQLKKVVLHSTGVVDVNFSNNTRLEQLIINNCPYLTQVNLTSNANLNQMNIDESVYIDLPLASSAIWNEI